MKLLMTEIRMNTDHVEKFNKEKDGKAIKAPI